MGSQQEFLSSDCGVVISERGGNCTSGIIDSSMEWMFLFNIRGINDTVSTCLRSICLPLTKLYVSENMDEADGSSRG